MLAAALSLSARFDAVRRSLEAAGMQAFPRRLHAAPAGSVDVEVHRRRTSHSPPARVSLSLQYCGPLERVGRQHTTRFFFGVAARNKKLKNFTSEKGRK